VLPGMQGIGYGEWVVGVSITGVAGIGTRLLLFMGQLHCECKAARGLRVQLECLLVMAIVWRWHKMLPAELR
jgi:hypothetical protein